jgi:hypothetical protein
MRLFPALAALLVPSTLSAQPACAPYDDVVQQLAERFHEHPVAWGADQRGVVAQIFATDDGKTWTLVFVRSDGVACLVAGGVNWRSQVIPGRGA